MKRSSPIPLYRQLQQHLRRLIDAEEYAPGDRLPGEQELQDKFDISRTTVRQAFRELEMAGLITRHRGRGTFVAQPKVGHSPGHSIDARLQAEGRHAGWVLLTKGMAEAPLPAADKLSVDPGTPVWGSTRLRLADDEAIGHVQTWVHPSVTGFEPQLLTGGGSSDYLHATGRLDAGTAERVIEAVACDEVTAPMLGVDPGEPMLRVTRLLLDADDQPVEFFIGLFRGDRFQYLLVRGAA